MAFVSPFISRIIDKRRSLLRQRSLAVFGCFVGGYQMAAVQAQRTFDKGWLDADFVEWLEKELILDSQDTHDSYSIVSLAFPDDHDALDAYISLLERYCSDSSRLQTTGFPPRDGCATAWNKGGDLREALASLRRAPRMYIRSGALCNLRGWIDGFLYAHEENGATPDGISDFARLCDRIRQQAMLPKHFEWDRAITFNWTDDGPALERFFAFCDEVGFLTGTVEKVGSPRPLVRRAWHPTPQPAARVTGRRKPTGK